MLIFQRLKLNAKGFTLLEVLVAAALSVVLLTGLYSIYISVARTNRDNAAKAELTQNARIALERMTRDIRQAQRIATTLPEDASDPLNPPPSQILFQDGHDTSKIQYIQYRRDGANLIYENLHYYFSSNPSQWVEWNAQDPFGNPPVELITFSQIKADHLSDLKFYGEKIITIELQVANDATTFDFKTQVLGRNIL